MKVYASGDNFVLGVRGGYFKEFSSDPKAIITKNRPIPTKKWMTPEEQDVDLFKSTTWIYNYEFLEFLCDDELKYILRIENTREVPAYVYGEAAFFLESDYAKDKIEELRNRGKIAEYHWDASVPTWIEVERGFKCEDEYEEEEEF